eukprot:snap_masked-scaffold_6-processed-gene-4.20-mRNA-1 protein AED:1.00 eAED:1.00 QI:0/0/0/0/1/1/2/0/77
MYCKVQFDFMFYECVVYILAKMILKLLLVSIPFYLLGWNIRTLDTIADIAIPEATADTDFFPTCNFLGEYASSADVP